MVAHSAHHVFRNLTDRACVSCPSTPPPCTCSANDLCVLIEVSCTSCSRYECVSNSSPSSSSGSGVSAGAVAGAVVASVIFLALVIGAFWFYRRRLRQRREAAAGHETKQDVPARAEDVLNRPDPNEKQGAQDSQPEPERSTLRIYSGSGGMINLDPESQPGSTLNASDGPSRRDSNPFGDNHSIQTTSTGTQSNVIPIALVPPASFLAHSQQANALAAQSSDSLGASSGPARPPRAPDVDLDLEHLNFSRETAGGKSDARSMRSGFTNRASYQSTGSFASDFLNEAPVIVTPTRGAVKQVVGVVKAEVIRTSPGNSPTKSGDGGLRPSNPATRPATRSPLAASSFGPSDVVHEAAEDDQEAAVRANPFGDENAANLGTDQASPAPSASTFGPDAVASLHSQAEEAHESAARPVSTYTQAASIVGSVIGAEIGGATRVRLGYDQLRPQQVAVAPHTASSGLLTPRTPNRMTGARIVNTPPAGNAGGVLEQQQQRGMQEIDPAQNMRMSMASVVSTSTRADSILESFPFVPPSPISNRPIRTPPRSPLAQQSFANNNSGTNSPKPPFREPPARESRETPISALSPPPRPSDRKALGMSVASQSSTMSNGLSSFPFQIDSGNGADGSSAPPTSYPGRQRASLDTLALTSDLSSYPLNFNRSTPPPPLPRP